MIDIDETTMEGNKGPVRWSETWLKNTVLAGLLWEKNIVRLVWWIVNYEEDQPAGWMNPDQWTDPACITGVPANQWSSGSYQNKNKKQNNDLQVHIQRRHVNSINTIVYATGI